MQKNNQLSSKQFYGLVYFMYLSPLDFVHIDFPRDYCQSPEEQKTILLQLLELSLSESSLSFQKSY